MHRLAALDLDRAYLAVAKRAPLTTAAWVARFERAIMTLEHHPERCSLALESRKSTRSLRELHFGKKPNVFRAVFAIDDRSVRILRILRAQRRPLTRREINDASEEGRNQAN